MRSDEQYSALFLLSIIPFLVYDNQKCYKHESLIFVMRNVYQTLITTAFLVLIMIGLGCRGLFRIICNSSGGSILI